MAHGTGRQDSQGVFERKRKQKNETALRTDEFEPEIGGLINSSNNGLSPLKPRYNTFMSYVLLPRKIIFTFFGDLIAVAFVY